MNRDTAFILSASALCAVTILSALAFVFMRPAAVEPLPAGIDIESVTLSSMRELSERTITSFEYLENGLVQYAYLGDRVPERIAADEVPELRTANSYTRYDGVVEDGPEPLLGFTSIFFPQPTFQEDAEGKWRVIEYAVATKETWNARPHSFAERLQEFFLHTAHAAAATVYSGAGDGRVSNFGGTWTANHDASTGTSAASTGTSITINPFATGGYNIDRGFVPFDTSSIPAAASISAATLNLYITATGNFNNDGDDFFTVVRTSQGTHTTLTTSDFNDCGTATNPTEGIDVSERKDVTSIGINAYLSFTLNTTGIGWIAKSGVASNCSATAGISCFGIREGHDVVNEPILSDGNAIIFSASETTGTSQDPYLTVTYAIKKSVSLNGGRIKVDGGRFRFQAD